MTAAARSSSGSAEWVCLQMWRPPSNLKRGFKGDPTASLLVAFLAGQGFGFCACATRIAFTNKPVEAYLLVLAVALAAFSLGQEKAGRGLPSTCALAHESAQGFRMRECSLIHPRMTSWHVEIQGVLFPLDFLRQR